MFYLILNLLNISAAFSRHSGPARARPGPSTVRRVRPRGCAPSRAARPPPRASAAALAVRHGGRPTRMPRVSKLAIYYMSMRVYAISRHYKITKSRRGDLEEPPRSQIAESRQLYTRPPSQRHGMPCMAAQRLASQLQ